MLTNHHLYYQTTYNIVNKFMFNSPNNCINFCECIPENVLMSYKSISSSFLISTN